MTRETMISTVVGMVGNHARVAAGILHSAGLIGSDAAGNADEIIAAARAAEGCDAKPGTYFATAVALLILCRRAVVKAGHAFDDDDSDALEIAFRAVGHVGSVRSQMSAEIQAARDAFNAAADASDCPTYGND